MVIPAQHGGKHYRECFTKASNCVRVVRLPGVAADHAMNTTCIPITGGSFRKVIGSWPRSTG